MRSGGSVLEAPPGAEEGALPPRALSACRLRGTVPRALSSSHRYKPHTGIEKALRYVGEPFLYVLELANLNLDGIAGMRNGGGPILKAPGPFTYWGAEEGALPREHRPRCRLRRTVPRASSACRSRGAGAPSSRRPSAAEGALPREREPVRRYW